MIEIQLLRLEGAFEGDSIEFHIRPPHHGGAEIVLLGQMHGRAIECMRVDIPGSEWRRFIDVLATGGAGITELNGAFDGDAVAFKIRPDDGGAEIVMRSPGHTPPSLDCLHIDICGTFWKAFVAKLRPSTPTDLAELRAIVNAATPGPWTWADEWGADPNTRRRFLWNEHDDRGVLNHGDVLWEISEANAAFLARARTAVPELLDEVERLRAELAVRS